jgi:hypothetical protein
MNDYIISRLQEVPGGVAEDAIVEITNLKAENARLREALQSVLNACDQGRMLERGAVSLTIDVPDPANCYYGVPAWPIEEARALLGETQ